MPPRDRDDLRTFFAVDLGEAARREARAVADRVASQPGGDAMRWVRPEAYHVTLRFLGSTPRGCVDDVVAAARRATRGIAPFSLQLGALLGFPTPLRARLIVVDVQPHDPLVALAAALEEAAVEAGFEPEERAFRPHLTLARLRARHRRAPLLDPKDGPADPAPFFVGSFALYQSERGAGGSVYTPLEHVALDGERSP